MTDAALPDTDIVHPAEIAALLGEAAAQQVRLELQGPAGEALSLAIVRVDAERRLLVLRWPELQATALPTWLQPGSVQAHASLAKIRIDFTLDAPLHLHRSEDLPELHLPLPQRLRRHQRRQAFRVAPLSQTYPRVLITLPGRAQPLRLATADLSAGGVALQWPPALVLPQVNDRFEQAELELSRDLRLALRLQVQHVGPPEGSARTVGCAFDALPPQVERVLLLQLQQLQRRHRTLGAGS
jgi:c-di-GMP-binding flagellar brake protein YcgR